MDENPSRILKKRQNGVFLILVGVSIVMLILSTKSLTGLPERVGLSIASFFQNSFHRVGEFFGDTANSIVELKQLKNNYANALTKISQYESMERSFADIRQENERLKEQLGYSREQRFKKISAEIIAKDPENVYSTIVINKGIKDGIKKDFPIIAFQDGIQGLVGRVVEVGRSTSIVMPLYDSSSHIACRLEKSRYEGLVTGQNRLDKPLLMQYVKKSSKDEIQFGDLVVTSGLAGLYPKDLSVGRVKEKKIVDYKTSMELELDPIIDFSRLEFVFAVLPVTEASE
jgi:rod shape-determining protein MreC